MPCLANELGMMAPFGAMQNFNGKTFVANDPCMARVCWWRVRARSREPIRDLRHAVPLLSEKTKAEERGRD